MNTVSLRAYAKINLSLDVVGTRADGYHLLESVFQGVSLYDSIRVRREQGAGGIRLRCNLPYIPTDGRNIMCKTAAAFFAAAGIREYQVSIDLRKTIPSGAGFGGGSADGAAVFSALCSLYRREFSTEEAIALLAPLGADIPFFLYSGTMLATGIGEVLTPAPPLPPCTIVLAKPKASASTRAIFEKLQEQGLSNRPDTPAVLNALRAGDLRALAAATGNVLEPVTTALCPGIAPIRRALSEQGALLTMMSGSGSGVFGIFESSAAAREAAQALRRVTRQIYITHPICRPMKTRNN